MNSNNPRLADILSRFEKVKRSNDGWITNCPVPEHGRGRGDKNPSLSISEGDDGRVLLNCHAGCSTDAILSAMGLTTKDLFPQNGHRSEIEASYDYEDEEGELLYQVVRKDPKGFFQRRPDGKGGWINNVGNTRKVLYRLPQLLAAAPSEPVFVVEGEKDAENLGRLGLTATTYLAVPASGGLSTSSFSRVAKS